MTRRRELPVLPAPGTVVIAVGRAEAGVEADDGAAQRWCGVRAVALSLRELGIARVLDLADPSDPRGRDGHVIVVEALADREGSPEALRDVEKVVNVLRWTDQRTASETARRVAELVGPPESDPTGEPRIPSYGWSALPRVCEQCRMKYDVFRSERPWHPGDRPRRP